MPDDSPIIQPESVHEADARRLLQDAAVHLAHARTALLMAPPAYRAAAPDVRLCAETALAAYTTWQGMVVPDRTDLAAVAEQVARIDSILRTPAHRFVVLLPNLEAAESGARHDLAVREAVETGWYTARNLIVQVSAAMPASARLRAFDPAQPLHAPASRTRDRVEVSSEDSFPASDAPGWQPLVVGATPQKREVPAVAARAAAARRLAVAARG